MRMCSFTLNVMCQGWFLGHFKLSKAALTNVPEDSAGPEGQMLPCPLCMGSSPLLSLDFVPLVPFVPLFTVLPSNLYTSLSNQRN